MTQSILLLGATGLLGSRIAHHLLGGKTTVRLLVRPGTMSNPTKLAQLAPLLEQGARVVEASLTDQVSLQDATRGIDVIVSALQGGADVIIDGQLALLHAAQKNGVRRFLTSDFAIDLFKVPDGEHSKFNMRRHADEIIAASGIEHVHVLNGAFMDNFIAGFGVTLDRSAGTASFWGHGTEVFDATSVEDTAKYTARAAVDLDLPNGKFAVSGQRLTINAVIAAIEEVSGIKFHRQSLGTITELEAAATAARAIDPDSMQALGDSTLVYMLNGRARLTDLQNSRYPDLKPETYLEHAWRTWQ